MQKGTIPLNIFCTVKRQVRIEQSCTEPYFRALCFNVWLGYVLAISCLIIKEALFSVEFLTLFTFLVMLCAFSVILWQNLSSACLDTLSSVIMPILVADLGRLESTVFFANAPSIHTKAQRQISIPP